MAQCSHFEQHNRRRVVSHIRNELRAQVVDDLLAMAVAGKMSGPWATAGQINQSLEQQGYWAGHAHVLACFLSSAAQQEIVLAALQVLADSHPQLWQRDGERFRVVTHDWNAYAAAKANEISNGSSCIERTALCDTAQGTSILFGPGAGDDDRELAGLRHHLHLGGIPLLGAGFSDDNRVWVVVVRSQNPDALKDALFESWQEAFVRRAAHADAL